MILEGFISIKAAIKAKNRTIEKVLISNKKRTRKSSYIKKICVDNKIEYQFCEYEKIANIAVKTTHGGFVAYVSEREYLSVEELLKKDYNDCFYLLGIEDPYNLGIIIRALYSSGIEGIFLENKDYSNVSSTISKSSAGTFEKMDIAKIDNVKNDIDKMKKHRYKLIAACKNDFSENLYKEQFNEKNIFIVGGEKRGISSEIIDQSDLLLHIPYGNENFGYSLPAVIATTVIAFEIYRRKN